MTALPTPPSYNVKGQTKQSKKMPYWLWYIIAKSLGIKLHPRDKPLLAIILHAITLFSGGGMFLTRIWFSGTFSISCPKCIHFNRSSRRKRGMASNPLFIIPDFFFCFFRMNFAMATLGLKEMGNFLWIGREKSLSS